MKIGSYHPSYRISDLLSIMDRILLLGQHVFINEKIVQWLEDEGYDVISTFNEMDAKRQLRSTIFHSMIITKRNDMDFVKKIHHYVSKEHPSIKIVVSEINRTSMVKQLE